MIKIKKSPTADTRTCDFKNVSKETLQLSSACHIYDVGRGIDFFIGMLKAAADLHDSDKLTAINQFHADFITGFKQTGWWDDHRKITRHHLQLEDGVPANVSLIDVLEMIVDSVMAGMARAGDVYPVKIKPEVLQKAFDNTVELLKSKVRVVE